MIAYLFLGVACLKRCFTCQRLPLRKVLSKYLYFTALPVLIVGRRKTPINKASPSPDIDSLENKIETEAINSTPKNKSKKITTSPIEITSDEEVIETPTPKAKSTLANRNTASTPSKTKSCVLIWSVLFLLYSIFFSSGSNCDDQRELSGRVKGSSKKSCVVSFYNLYYLFTHAFTVIQGFPPLLQMMIFRLLRRRRGPSVDPCLLKLMELISTIIHLRPLQSAIVSFLSCIFI